MPMVASPAASPTRYPCTSAIHGCPPDGQWIYFLATPITDQNAVDVYRLHRHGRHLERLTDTPGPKTIVGWASTTTLVLRFWQPAGDSLYRLATDGRTLQFITTQPETFAPRFPAPDAQFVVYTARQGGALEVYRARADGTQVQNLSQSSLDDWYESWSPDGQWLIFGSNRDGNAELYRTRSDGSGLQNLTQNPAEDMFVGWSPDGQWLMLRSNRSGTWTLYRLRSDGRDLQRLTDVSFDQTVGGWSPDGQWLVYMTSYCCGNTEIERIRPDGTAHQRLTHSRTAEVFVGWTAPLNLPWHPWLVGSVSLVLLALAAFVSLTDF